jgi:hypothetical protein
LEASLIQLQYSLLQEHVQYLQVLVRATFLHMYRISIVYCTVQFKRKAARRYVFDRQLRNITNLHYLSTGIRNYLNEWLKRNYLNKNLKREPSLSILSVLLRSQFSRIRILPRQCSGYSYLLHCLWVTTSILPDRFAPGRKF